MFHPRGSCTSPGVLWAGSDSGCAPCSGCALTGSPVIPVWMQHRLCVPWEELWPQWRAGAAQGSIAVQDQSRLLPVLAEDPNPKDDPKRGLPTSQHCVHLAWILFSVIINPPGGSGSACPVLLTQSWHHQPDPSVLMQFRAGSRWIHGQRNALE